MLRFWVTKGLELWLNEKVTLLQSTGPSLNCDFLPDESDRHNLTYKLIGKLETKNGLVLHLEVEML